jgi:polyvinyl alcohol dehydrogenase (cytochrome)
MISVISLLSVALAQAPTGAALFEARCATCHVGTTDARVPPVDVLRERTPQAIVDALTTGAMREVGSELTDAQRRAIAEFLTSGAAARTPGAGASSGGGRCATVPSFDPTAGPRWTAWSGDLANTRFQPSEHAGLRADQVPTLALKWAFGFPNATSARGLPTVAGGRLFVGSDSGAVYALDAKSGCTIWTFTAKAAVRSGLTIGPLPPRDAAPRAAKYAAFFGDGRSNVYAVDAASGELIWTRTIDDHPSARVTGTPALFEDRLFVPVASGEEGQGFNPKYECCTFRGSLVALDAATGSLVWKTYTIANEAKPIGKNASGTTRWGPSGAGIWSAPTVDPKRHVVYAATGNMYSEPQQPTSDAIMAFDLDTGAVKWTSQVTPADIFVVGCGDLGLGPAVPTRNGVNCPSRDILGPDFDFGQAPMLATLPNGRELLVAGQKSGVGWAFDPDKRGEVVWQYRAGKGSALGGMEFGSAVDAQQAYFAVSDTMGSGVPGGLHAVKLADGTRAWFAPPPPPKCAAGPGRGCNAALLGAITAIPGVVFTGSNDGGVRGYATRDGSLLWEFDTNREFETVNGVPAKGASINGPGPVVVGGMVYINSGYGALGGRPGNVLLAFGPP